MGCQVSPRGDLPNPGIEPTSTALQVNSLLLSHQGSPCCKNPRDTNVPSAVVDRPCSNLSSCSHHGGIGAIPLFPFSVDTFRAPSNKWSTFSPSHPRIHSLVTSLEMWDSFLTPTISKKEIKTKPSKSICRENKINGYFWCFSKLFILFKNRGVKWQLKNKSKCSKAWATKSPRKIKTNPALSVRNYGYNPVMKALLV